MKTPKDNKPKTVFLRDYSRKHDLTTEEIRTSPVFNQMNDQQVEQVINTFRQFCLIAMEYIDNQQNKFAFKQNGSDIAGEGKIIELKPPKDKAA